MQFLAYNMKQLENKTFVFQENGRKVSRSFIQWSCSIWKIFIRLSVTCVVISTTLLHNLFWVRRLALLTPNLTLKMLLYGDRLFAIEDSIFSARLGRVSVLQVFFVSIYHGKTWIRLIQGWTRLKRRALIGLLKVLNRKFKNLNFKSVFSILNRF